MKGARDDFNSGTEVPVKESSHNKVHPQSTGKSDKPRKDSYQQNVKMAKVTMPLNYGNTFVVNPLAKVTKDSIQMLDGNLNARKYNIFGNKTYINNKVRSWMAPTDNPVNVKIFGGRRAVKEEQIRSKKAGLIIHPYSTLRYYWDMIMLILLATNMVGIPLNIAFFHTEVTWIVFHSVSDIIFILDIFINFRTGYKDENGYRMTFVLEPKKIAKRYATSWLAMDIISSFPYDNFLLILNEGGGYVGFGVQSASKAFKFLRLVKLLSLLKLARLSRFVRYMTKFEEFYQMTASFIRYIKLILMMLLVAHWNGCLAYLIPMLQGFPENCWVRLNNLTEAHWSQQYGWALFKALSHMLCIGYGRFIPQLLSEALITIFSMITGATFYALFIAHSMAYIQQSDPARRQYQEKFKQIEEYMSYRNLPLATREHITDYYEHKYSQKRLFDESQILSEVSAPLRNDIVSHNCKDLIENVPFLRQGGQDFISLIVSCLQFDVYLPGNIIIKEGSFGDQMFFIRHGVVDVRVESNLVASLTEGEYFGEITMLTNARRVATVSAATVCDLFILTKDNLYRALEEFPDMRQVMEEVALGRLIKIREQFPECVNADNAYMDVETRSRKVSKVSETTFNDSASQNRSDVAIDLSDFHMDKKTRRTALNSLLQKESHQRNVWTIASAPPSPDDDDKDKPPLIT